MNHLIQEAKLMQLKAGLITEDEYREAVTTPPTSPIPGKEVKPAATGKVQGTINPALFKGLGIEDFEPNKFSGIVQKIKNNQGLTAFENKVLSNVFVAMIKTKDDAMLSKIFNNLKSVEAK